MNNEQLLQLYFSNSLTPSQEDHFNDLLKSDAQFKAQFEFENNLKEVIKTEETDKLRSKLKDFEAQQVNNEEHSKSWFNWRVAASVLLFLGVGWFGYDSFFGIDYDDLYENNYQNYPNTVYTITRGDDTNSLEREAFVAYETQDFKVALDKFNAIKTKPTYFNFYKAQSFLGLNNLEQAKTLFDKEITNDGKFKAESHWFLALVNLKQENETEAIKNLKTLITKYNYKKEEAKALLNDLN